MAGYSTGPHPLIKNCELELAYPPRGYLTSFMPDCPLRFFKIREANRPHRTVALSRMVRALDARRLRSTHQNMDENGMFDKRVFLIMAWYAGLSLQRPHWQDLVFRVRPVNQQAVMPRPRPATKLDNNMAEFGP